MLLDMLLSTASGHCDDNYVAPPYRSTTLGGQAFTRLTHNRQNCIVLGRLPSVLTKHWKAAPPVGWVTSNRVWETGKTICMVWCSEASQHFDT